jgi:thioester reductase-like protein
VLVLEGSLARLDRLIERWGRPRPAASGPVVGDLQLPRLGLSDDVAVLAGNVEHLFHLAAMYA